MPDIQLSASRLKQTQTPPNTHGKLSRNPNLDLLRAGAILMVLVHHIFLKWPVFRENVSAVTEFGRYGVDLFFVLSGWLIGGLLWRENERFGNVQVPRFILRRALRTVPPYLVALGLSYLAVRIARREPFDFSYLLFLQNYQRDLPFFQISWSLCIEEHFYLLLPFIALSVVRLRRHSHFLLLATAILPIIFRALSFEVEYQPPFGYRETATHLRYEGLLMGVWAAFIYVYRPSAWKILQRIAKIGSIPAFAMLIVTARLPEVWNYVFFYSAVAVFCCFLLVTLVDRKPVPFATSRPVLWVASIAYSLYLTNQLFIHFALRLMDRTPFLPEAVHFLIMLLGITGVGFAFYRFVEAPSLAIRHRLIPNRSQEQPGGASLS